MSLQKSRTQYSAINASTAVLTRMVAIVMGYITRVVFTHTLSGAYVGINGLFTDILNVLSLSELGVGTAITFSLYKPIAENNHEKIKSLMQLYKQLYRVVAGIVLVAGLSILPFMDLLIKNKAQIDNITLIYLMYLGNSVISYLLVYKRTLIDANQLAYICILYQTSFLVIQDIIQIFILRITKNFTLFLLIYILCTIGMNIMISRKADRLYPYLREKNIAPLDIDEKKSIRKNITAMLMHKIGDTVINNTDNLILSAFVGIMSVGCYSNYYLVIGSIRQILDQIFFGITASVGNLGVTEKNERVENVFNVAFFIGQWLYGFAAICLFELSSLFVEISFGKEYVFSDFIVFMFCLQFYLLGLRKAVLAFRDSLGLFWFDRYKSIVEAFFNLVLSLIFVRILGVAGIFLGTVVSTLMTSMWIEPYVLYKIRLKKSVIPYLKNLFRYVIIMGVTFVSTHMICIQIDGGIFRRFILRLLVCAILSNGLLLVIYFRSNEFRKIRIRLCNMIASRKRML